MGRTFHRCVKFGKRSMSEHPTTGKATCDWSGLAPVDMEIQLRQLRTDFYELYECVDVERALAWAREYAPADVVDDFGREEYGGRGESYRRAQTRNITARAHGISQMLDFIRNGTGATRKKVVDVLGGDGLVRRVVDSLGFSDLNVLTCDISPYMVSAAWRANVPALLQKADHLLQRDDSVDGVLVAYGSHHVDPADRATLVREAHRVLRPGGVLVVHDFLVGTPMETWFGEVVDRYSQTGHRYTHFTAEEMRGYLVSAGFDWHEITDLADPYVATGATPVDAELNLGRYLLDMYGLVEVERLATGEASRWAIEQAKQIFRYPDKPGWMSEFSVRYDEIEATWRCTIPRMAIVGVGRKAL